jgi:hypothetical protein
LVGAIVYVWEIVRFFKVGVSCEARAARTYSTLVLSGATVTRRCPEFGRMVPRTYWPSVWLPVLKFGVPGCGHSW